MFFSQNMELYVSQAHKTAGTECGYFNPEERSSTFLRNDGIRPPHYTEELATKPRTIPDSSVSIALGCGLDDRGSRVRFPAGAGNFSLHHRVLNGSGAHTKPPIQWITGIFPWG
jgi:hypothetical protein